MEYRPVIEAASTYEEVGRLAAQRIASQIYAKPNFVLGPATGDTMLPFYCELVRMHNNEGLDLSRVITFNPDEYIGLPPEHPQSYHTYMRRHLFDHVNIAARNIHIPNGMALNLDKECLTFEAWISAVGGIDCQMLGIGENGHIGFCEPGTAFDSRTHIADLTEQTRMNNARYFDSLEVVPKRAVTVGIRTILDAKQIILLASGPKKQQAISHLLHHPVDPAVPATALRLHQRVELIADRDALAVADRYDHRERFQPQS